MEKYNSQWLKYKNMSDNWYDERQKELQSYIENCKCSILKLIVRSPDELEAYAPILFNYTFSLVPGFYYGFEMHELTIYIK